MTTTGESSTPPVNRRAALRQRLGEMTFVGGTDRTALFALFGLNVVDEFDRIAFGTLTPEIRDAFDLTDQQIVAVGSISSVFVLLGAIPIGYITDRYPRLRLAKIAALTWGVMMILTGTATAVPLLFAARFFSGIAKSSNEIVHTGLLADYYEQRYLPRILQFHRMANPLSNVSSLLVGAIAVFMGWRVAFVLLAIPTFLLVLKMRKLPDPDRGASIDKEAATLAADAKHTPYWQATKELLQIRTMRRIWSGFIIFGVGIVAFVQMVSLFFDDVYGFGPFARGFVTFIFGVGSVAGMVLAGQLGTRFTLNKDYGGLMRMVALGFTVFAAGVLGMALAPWAALSVVFAPIASAGVASVTPLIYTALVATLPPRIRAQGHSFAMVAIGIGAIFAIPIAGIGESENYRLAFVILAGFMFAAVPVIYSARRFLETDIAAAAAKLRNEAATVADDGDTTMQ